MEELQKDSTVNSEVILHNQTSEGENEFCGLQQDKLHQHTEPSFPPWVSPLKQCPQPAKKDATKAGGRQSEPRHISLKMWGIRGRSEKG